MSLAKSGLVFIRVPPRVSSPHLSRARATLPVSTHLPLNMTPPIQLYAAVTKLVATSLLEMPYGRELTFKRL